MSAVAVRLERQQDRGLQPVGVLIFVDQHMIEALANVGGERGLGHHVRPVEQQIVVIEHVLALLGLDIGGEQRAQLAPPMPRTRESSRQHLVERRLAH